MISINDILLTLPRSISHQVVAFWLKLRDLTALDVAQNCRASRVEYLNLISSDEFVLPKLPKIERATFQAILDWLIARKVKISVVYFPTGVKLLKEFPCEKLFDLIGPSLRSLHFDWSLGNTSTMLGLVGKHCKKLNKFGVEFSTLTGEFRDVLHANSLLRELRLNECVNIRPGYFNHYRYPSLQSIFLNGSKVVPKAVAAISIACVNLRRLQITGNKQMNDVAAHAIAENCNNLQALNLSGCNRISELAIVAIFTACTTLTEIDISSCDRLTNQAILALTAHCTQVSKVLIQKNARYTDDALHAIASAYATTLRLLYISECENMTSTGIAAVAKQCTFLTCLDIGYIPYIGTSALMAVSVRNLVELVLSSLVVTDPVLTNIAKNCRLLSVLHMYYTQGFSVHGIYAVVTRCKQLQELLINADSEIVTPRTVQRFALWNPGLVVVTDNYLLGCGVLD